MAPPGGEPPPGAVETGGAGGSAGPEGPGMLPPSAGPVPQNVPPRGNEALGMEVMRKITGALHFARILFGPGSEMLKVVDQLYNKASKHFQPDASAMKGGEMPPPAQLAQGPGGAPGGGGGPPPLAAGPGAMPPPSPPRGPIPMPAGGGGAI